MKYIYLLLILLFTGTVATAQIHTLKLSKLSLPALQREFYIEEVFDCRVAKDVTGLVQTGLLNNKANAVFQNPLDQELLAFIAKHHLKQDGQTPVILRVNKLWVSELTTFDSETSTAELIVDFIYKQDNTYHKLYTATSLISQSGPDVTKKHEANIAAALYNCLKEFSTKDFGALLAQSEALTKEEARGTFDNIIPPHDYPIMQTDTPTTGVYMSFEEFRNNIPSITSGYDIRHRNVFNNMLAGGGELTPVLTMADGKRKAIKDAWGFIHENKAYINYGGAFYPLSRDGQRYSFIGLPIDNNSNASAVAGMVGGAIGGAIGGALVGGMVSATAMPDVYSLDMLTGTVYYNGKPAGLSIANAKLVLYRVSENEKEAPIRIQLNGEERLIDTNELIELSLSTTDVGTSVCLTGDESACINFMPTPGKVYYISCTWSRKKAGSKAELKEVKETVGEHEVKGIRFAQKRSAKKSK